MILTGKAKMAFIDHHWQSKFKEEDYKEYEGYLDKVELNHLYSDIIEWFDSVGIYINITPLYIGHEDRYSQGLFYSTLCFKDGRDTLCADYDSKAPMLNRKEVTEMAIQKANDIFNETK